ncbi:heterokaryon incompatibility protein-domain-containing protein [Rhexocercosporidium sp. MPI-PUGE-AT-0058]|nr:heterokaryon incompatibility protein-domain-containing protein [Rhexocercosporidium sp. MPI-PUGE-AT-0058]
MDPVQPGSGDTVSRQDEIVDTEISDININTDSKEDDGDNLAEEGLREKRKRRPWHRNEQEIENSALESYTFTNLNLETKEMRFLNLNPHHGKAESPLKVSLSIEPLDKCEPYTALVNTRGNPFDAALIIIDNALSSTSPNIWTYLDDVRDEIKTKRFWFRDICINHRLPEEKAEYWNQEWMDTMSRHAENVIDMSEAIMTIWDQGKLEPPFEPRPQNDRSYGDLNFNIHSPIPLAFAAEYAKGVARLPDHTYLPLDYVANETRIITVRSSDNYDDPLVGLIGYNPMHNGVSFSCVSYMWGNEEATELIELSGQRFLIRKNLDTFLRTMRKPGGGYLRFWIDAVCIDQSNISERNRQLPRILSVYEDADVVACWVGEPDETSDLALGLVSDLRPTHFSAGNILFERGWLEVKNREDFPRRLAALYRFLLRPYFRRIWVAQELAAARRPYIICGKDFIVEWKRLDHATWRLLDILYSDKDLTERIYAADPSLKNVPHSELSFVRRLFYLRHLRHGRTDEIEENSNTLLAQQNELWYDIPTTAPGILDIVTLCRDFQSTVPHDKVFALWNLATDTKGMEFTMDYTKPLSETWLEFAAAVAKKNDSLDIICAAEPNVADGLTIPSWCADWSTPATVSSMVRQSYIPITLMRAINDIGGPMYSAAGAHTLNPRFSFDGTILECAGVVLDTVGLIGPYEVSDSTLVEQPIWNDWMEMAAGALQADEDAALPLLEQNFQARFWGMLAGKSEGGSNDLRKYVPGWDGKGDALIKSNGRDMYSVVTRGRCLVITEDSFMGLAPHYVKEGAKIAILSCCSSPVILYENEDGTHRFGGSCFVQGWMRGEMLTRFGTAEEEAWEAIDNMGRIRIV